MTDDELGAEAIRFDRVLFWLACAAIAACLLVPLLIIASRYEPVQAERYRGAAQVTVGLAAILRATAQRFIRTSARGFLRTTFSTFTRAGARTVTRRFVRASSRSLIGLLSKQSFGDVGTGLPERHGPGWSALALGAGYVGLCLSFWGVLLTAEARSGAPALSQGIRSVPAACLLSGVPLLVAGLLSLLAAKVVGGTIHITTGLDGLLIQAYFTGAGSFLPMTTDIQVRGSDHQRAVVSAAELGGTYLIHLILFALAHAWQSALLNFSASMFLVYAFVFCFPISPLAGHDLWRRSKLLWMMFFAPILLSFLFGFSSNLAGLV